MSSDRTVVNILICLLFTAFFASLLLVTAGYGHTPRDGRTTTTVFRTSMARAITFPNTQATTTSTTAATTTTSAETSTPTPLLAIVCPPDRTIDLNLPAFGPDTTGNAVAIGGCSTPVVTYEDNVQNMLARRKGTSVKPTARLAVNVTTQTDHSASLVRTAAVKPRAASVQDNMEAFYVTEAGSGEINLNIPYVLQLDKRRRRHHKRVTTDSKSVSQLMQKFEQVIQNGPIQARSPSFSDNYMQVYDGIRYENSGAAPSDNTAATDGTYIVNAFNSDQGSLVSVRTTALPQTAQALFYMQTLGNGACAASTRGDPQVLYDATAQRWIMLELSDDSTDALCLYASETTDPLGAWRHFHLVYQFFPDFAKIATWSALNAYAISVNHGSNKTNTLCVLQRSLVLAGSTPPAFICDTPVAAVLDSFGFQAWTPSPQHALFVRHRDDELHSPLSANSSYDFLDVEQWSAIDFSGGTFSRATYSVPIAEFDSSYDACTPSADECITTPSAQNLDPIREVVVLSANLQGQSVVGAFTSHANGVDRARVHWFELRLDGDERWGVFQEGAVNPQSLLANRWVPAIVIDEEGIIVLGYSLSSSTILPTTAVTYRLPSDPPGEMRTETPGTLAVPSGLSLPNNRWGDYAAMCASSAANRTYYFASQFASETAPWIQFVSPIRINGESYQRIFTATDECGHIASCVQIITATL